METAAVLADSLWKWLLLCAAILAGITARAGYRMGGNPPPLDDPEAFSKWRERQLWAAVGEFLSLPAFGGMWVLIDSHYNLKPEILIAGCIISGALGFGFWLEAIQRLINRRIENV